MRIYLHTFFIFFLNLSSFAEATYTVTVPAGTKDCFLVGDMTGWAQLRMIKNTSTNFSITLSYASLSDHYKYCSGPAWNFVETTATGGFLANRTYSANDLVEKWTLTWDGNNDFPPSIATGSVVRHYFNSSLVDDRYIDVWLPAGYNTAARYNVLYLQDGEMLFDPTWTWNGEEWNADSIMGALHAAATIEPTIVVGIHSNGNKRHAEYFPQKVYATIPEPQQTELSWYLVGNTGSDNYLKFIVHELKPYIDANFSTNPGQQNTYIGGASLGALVSLYALCEYPDIFSRVACLSSHWIGVYSDNTQIPAAINKYLNLHLPAPGGRKIYFDHGTLGLDSLYGRYQQNVNNTVLTKGYTDAIFSTQIFPGAGHNENSWRARFGIPAAFILSGSPVLASGIYNFRVISIENNEMLSWQAGEQSIPGTFTISRSPDGIHFNSIGSCPVTNQANYSFTDYSPAEGVNYYRISLEENTGIIHYSKIIAVKYAKLPQVYIYPNPAKNFLFIKGVNLPVNAPVSIFDSKGLRYNVSYEAGNKRLNISSLANGIYFLTSNNQIIKFIKQ